FVPGFEEVAFQGIVQHLMDISWPCSSYHLVDCLFGDPLGHGGGCLKYVDGLSEVALGLLNNSLQASLSGLQGLIFVDTVEGFDDLLLGERRETEQGASLLDWLDYSARIVTAENETASRSVILY